MSGPETKGILLVSVVQDVLRLEQEGRISRADLLAELGPDARKLVEAGTVSVVSWYPPDVYRDLARVLMRIEGRGPRDMAYLWRRGEKAGKRLVESGLYQQIDYMKRSGEAWRTQRVPKEDFERGVRLIASMQAALTRGSVWTVEHDPDHPDRIMIMWDRVTGLSEESAQATGGILTGITSQGGAPFAWIYERPSRDRILYRMDRDISALRAGVELGAKRQASPRTP
ncbi:MAG TPA: hypothetical protein VMW35_00045 [Myxococcota bacterium]|jgi:hypothetical protein|nr:hypothetical protein [Myxococcota bacterium]